MTEQGSTIFIEVPRAEQIARLNDRLRRSGEGGQIVITKGVMRLWGFDAANLREALASYDGFDAGNDPHGERDFGDLDLFNAELLWKIDYYDTSLKFGSEDPADASVTSRVLTVLLASEW